ncbi:protein kinase domain-containing protein [Actinoplanes solisilvae]|uniref:protein kinase domain-containing protein n=1 Tax=Actinoplanes solisilvae TaxID=2486853 RepID=UPI000FD95372|nr:protein kinase [Actinoplanes solisilvae]
MTDPPLTDPAPTGDPAGTTPFPFPDELRARVVDVQPFIKGQAAQLYRGRLGRHGQWVVVKVIERPDPPEPHEQIWELWRKADEKFVVPLLESGMTADGRNAYEITEHAPWGSLHLYLGNPTRPVTDGEGRQILTQISAAVNHIHKELPSTLLHRDIKPQNILVDQHEKGIRFRLTDFGSAKIYDPAVVTSDEPAVTWAYAAPETFRHRSEPASDWWSLGITMQELLLGRQPFRDLLKDDVELENRMNLATAPALNDVPEAWRPLVSRLWQRLEHRWTYPAVQAWLNDEDVDAHVRAGPDEPATVPFQFAGFDVRRPSELAAEMSRHWAAAASLVIGYQWGDLLTWGRTVSTEVSDNLAKLTKRLRFSDPGVERTRTDRLIAEVILVLDPYSKPVFRGREVNPESLAETARAASYGDRRSLEFVDSLFQSRSLQALSRHAGCTPLFDIEERWRNWYLLGRLLVAEALGSAGMLTDERLFIALLLEVSADPDAAPELAARAKGHMSRTTKRVGWYRKWWEATGDDAPLYHALIIAAHELAGRPEHRVDPAARKYALEQYRLAVQQPSRGTAVRAPRPTSGRAGGVAMRDRAKTRWRGVLPALGVLAAYTGFAVAAGTGVGAGTTRLQGGLVGGVLLLAGVVFAVARVAPASRLTNGVVGAGLGCLAGLVLAAGTAYAAHLFSGPAIAWPAFWATWVVTTVVMGMAGAAE